MQSFGGENRKEYKWINKKFLSILRKGSRGALEANLAFQSSVRGPPTKRKMPQRATFPAPTSTMHGLDHIAMQHHIQSPQHRSVLASSTTRARSVVSFLHRCPPAPRHLFAGVFCALPHDLHAVTNGFCRPPSSSLSSNVSSSSRFIALQAVSSDDHALHMYHSTDSPVASFGYATNFREHFEVKDTLGHGTFGSVFIAVRKKDGQRFAVKRMPKRFGPGGALDKYYVRRVRNEVEIGSHLGASLNIAYLYGAYEDDTRVDLVFELCSGGELWSRIKSGHAYTERDAARLVRDVLRTVAQCHASGVLMRDIKPENFLFASKAPDAPLKAIDFGISVFCEPGAIVQLRAGTPIYIAPGA
jgi:tRNA A-37 threonylcarbamoyl transferase component Bud32